MLRCVSDLSSLFRPLTTYLEHLSTHFKYSPTRVEQLVTGPAHLATDLVIIQFEPTAFCGVWRYVRQGKQVLVDVSTEGETVLTSRRDSILKSAIRPNL